MKNIVFAGTFDPITNGHLWVMKEALEIAENLTVFVAENNSKKTMFNAEERKKMIEDSCIEYGIDARVSVSIVKNEYVAKKSLEVGATHLIRGMRSSVDFDYEELIQKTNVEVLGGAKTIFVMPPRDLESVSSSFVKSLIGPVGWHWNIKKFVPKAVYQKVLEDFIFKIAKFHISSNKLEDFLKLVFLNYGNSSRHYHNIEHLAHCLQEMLWLQNNSKEKVNYEQLCAAILAHDIIYGSHKDVSDEVLSAELLLEYLGTQYKMAYKLVLATQHFSEKKKYSLEEKIMRSIDLTILGQCKKVYKKYAKNVRIEYSYIDDERYKEGRGKVIEKFLLQEKIFEADIFNHYEEIARQNLKKELSKMDLGNTNE